MVWGVRCHPRSSETSPFDRAHMISYSTLIETICLSCTVFELKHDFRRKWQILTHPTCISRPRRGWSPSNFAANFGVRKWVTGLSCGVICVILRLAILTQYWSVTDTHTHTHTDTQTHRHTTTAYSTLSIASRGKNVSCDVTTPLSGTVCRLSARTS